MEKLERDGIVHLDLFSGTGGFALGLKQAGFKVKKHYFSEIDKHAIANYRYNFKEAEYVGSVTDVRGGELDQPDITTFGFPCQDLSLAGKRLGFKGKRSSLFYEAMRICRESNTKILIWENVAGLMSSNDGADMDAVFEEMYESGFIFDVNEQNTSWLLPQNRLRLYCIGYNINYLWEILKEQNGQIQKSNILNRITEGYLAKRFQNTLTDHQNQLPIRQHELALEHAKVLCQNDFLGQKRRTKLLEAMSILELKDLKLCYQDILDLLLKQGDISSEQLSRKKHIEKINQDTKSGLTETKEREELILNIDALLKNLSEESLINLSKFIISILLSTTTRSKTYTFARTHHTIELFIIALTKLCPNSWNWALSNLIKTEKYTRYAKDFNDKGFSTEEDDYDAIQVQITQQESNSLVGHLGNGGGRNVFPFGESFGRLNERSEQARGIRTLTAGGNSGGMHSSMTLIKVKSATTQGYETATEGDSVNLAQPNSETRRGRVGKGKAQTLETSCNQGVLVAKPRRTEEAKKIRSESMRNGKDFTPFQGKEIVFEESNEMNTITRATTKDNLIKVVQPVQIGQSSKTYAAKSGSLVGKPDQSAFTVRSSEVNGVKVTQLNQSTESGGKQPYQQNRVYDKEHLSPTIDQSADRWSFNTARIRRLTEIECEKLQGFPYSWTRFGINDKGETIEISRTQRYKMCGNAVTAKIVEIIVDRL